MAEDKRKVGLAYDWREVSKKYFPHCWDCKPKWNCEVSDKLAGCPYRKKKNKCCKYPDGGKPMQPIVSVCDRCARPCKSTGPVPMTACYNFTTLKPLNLSKDDRKLILDSLQVTRRMAYGLNFPYDRDDVDKVISQISN